MLMVLHLNVPKLYQGYQVASGWSVAYISHKLALHYSSISQTVAQYNSTLKIASIVLLPEGISSTGLHQDCLNTSLKCYVVCSQRA